MTTAFPTDKTQPFVADNGVTYYWDSDRWRVKQYKLDDAALEDYATEQWTEEKIADAMLDGTVDLSGYATVVYSDAEDANLQNQIDELGVTKGKVARYTCSSITGGFASRPGQLAFNSGDPTAVNQISFGTEDSDNVLTKPMANGDIIEFVDVDSGQVSRFKITDASGAPTGTEVEYISGNNDFNVGEQEQVYIYPQNEAGASKDYVDAQDALRLPLTGGTLSGEIRLNGGDDTDNLSIYPNVGNDDSAITALNGGALRFRTVATGELQDASKKTHLSIEQDDTGVPTTRIYHVATPTSPNDAVNKSYCDSMSGGGVPVGSIMIWMGTTAPDGWFKLQGGSFDVAAYPRLHAYLEATADYTSGKLPSWGGYYPGEWGSHLNDSLGKKVGQRTAMPSGGAPYHDKSIPNGNTRTFNGGGGTNAYSNGIARPAITEGWDNYTRPQTVIVHYIIKHD